MFPKPVILCQDVELVPETGALKLLEVMNRLRCTGPPRGEVFVEAQVEANNTLTVVVSYGLLGEEPYGTETLTLVWLRDWVSLGNI